MLPTITFTKPDLPKSGVAVLFAAEDLKLAPLAESLDAQSGGLLRRAAAAADFKGKAGSALDLIAPAGLDLDRIVVFGTGKADDKEPADWLKRGGAVMAKLSALQLDAATILLEDPAGTELAAAAVADFAVGIKLRAYDFDRYKTKKDDSGKQKPLKLALAVDKASKARAAFKTADGVADGVLFARDLVNEPANVLGPEEFADRAKELEKLGVEVTVLGEKDMKKLKMNALLGVAQGSARPSRLVIMRWNGHNGKTAPVCFVGKGVCFDSGGISLKPGAGMEDMKGDMGGAAAVTGAIHALAARKAKVDAVGIIGLVENMPDGKAQRPGDIVIAAD
ncbi:MAG: leucyl aminopeptidase, partial [Hyphomicrobiales bacterium]|nr:leucyl aminopeptidase [Hyphomicrobiales bacterium]